MLKHDPNYRRLPVTSRLPLGKATFWLARDHLFIVEVQLFHELYRRFNLRDIQALQVVPSRGALFLNLTLGMLLVVMLALVIIFGGEPAAVVVWLAVIALTALVLGWSLFLGPACRLNVRTAVQTAALPGIRRQRHAQRLWAELMPAILAAQADMVSTTVPAPDDATPAEEPGAAEG
jgi:hypothetical protein